MSSPLEVGGGPAPPGQGTKVKAETRRQDGNQKDRGGGVPGPAVNIWAGALVPDGPSLSPLVPQVPDGPSLSPLVPQVPGGPSLSPLVPQVPGGPSLSPLVPQVPDGPSLSPLVTQVPGGPSLSPLVPQVPGGPSLSPLVPQVPGGPSLSPLVPQVPGRTSLNPFPQFCQQWGDSPQNRLGLETWSRGLRVKADSGGQMDADTPCSRRLKARDGSGQSISLGQSHFS
ncbi:unnamed protein product [Gadus morhua 'NCC']